MRHQGAAVEIGLMDIVEVKIGEEWIEVWDGSLTISSAEFTTHEGPVYTSPYTFYRFRTHTDRMVAGPLSAIQGYRYHEPEQL